MGIRLYIYCALLCSSLFASQSIFNIHLSHQLETVSDHNSNEEYHIAFLLPFCVDNNEILFSGDLDSLMVDVDFLENYQFYKKTKISIDFFLGFLLSIDEFPGIDIKISLYDIQEGDMSKRVLRTILNEGDLDDVDLVVGPLFTDNVVFFSKRFRRSIPIISPFSKKSHITSHNNNVFQVPVDIMDQLSVFANQLFSAHQYDNILLLKRDTILDTLYRKIDGLEEYELTIDTIIPSDIAYGDIFLDVANNILSDTLQSMCFEEVKVSASIIDSIYHKLDTLGTSNIVIVSSDDDVFVTDLLSKLHACRNPGMVVYGLPALIDFHHVSIYDLMDMNVTFPHNKNFNYSELDDFLINFHNQYNYLPNLKYASVGYEIGIYFLQLLFNYGEIIPYIDNYGTQMILGNLYNFQQTTDGGYRNKVFSILRYHDFGYESLYINLE